MQRGRAGHLDGPGLGVQAARGGSSRTRESSDTLGATDTERIFAELAGKPLDRPLLNRLAEGVRDRGLVADLGCGPGHVARYLHERRVRMLGIDLALRMIEWARKLLPEIEFRVGDMRTLELPDGALAGIVACRPRALRVDLRGRTRTLAPGRSSTRSPADQEHQT